MKRTVVLPTDVDPHVTFGKYVPLYVVAQWNLSKTKANITYKSLRQNESSKHRLFGAKSFASILHFKREQY